MTTATFDLSPPRRPSLDDLGGGHKEEEVGFPADPVTDLTAEDVNQTAMVLTRLAHIAPAALVYVRSSSSATTARAIGLSSAPNAATPNVLDSAFTVQRTGVGKVTLRYDTGVIPTNGFPPSATIAFQSSEQMRMVQCAMTSDGIAVQTFDPAGAFQDADFVVTIY